MATADRSTGEGGREHGCFKAVFTDRGGKIYGLVYGFEPCLSSLWGLYVELSSVSAVSAAVFATLVVFSLTGQHSRSLSFM